jgi:uncharacterized membrane protein
MLMKRAVFAFIWFAFSCSDPAKRYASIQTDTLQKSTESEAYALPPQKDTVSLAPKPVREPVKNPSGIYEFLMPYKESKVEHMVQFFNNHTYRLQERYPRATEDSMVVTEGTWMPSNGFIWLYKEQLVQGRYKWKGNTLHYFNPGAGKTYPLQQRPDVMSQTLWKNRSKSGVLLYGLGNEPFWSVELTDTDTLNFQLADWSQPLQLKLEEKTAGSDSTVYTAQNDSARIRLTVFPYFCSDGMSDFVYHNKVRLVYNHTVYSGCGALYR